jgi:2-iminobutanoate/2-iminopropanoate deaminase
MVNDRLFARNAKYAQRGIGLAATVIGCLAMTIHRIVSEALMAPKAPLCHAVRVGSLVYCSGIHPYRLDRSVATGDFAAQTHQVFANLKAVLADAGTSLDHAVKMSVILVNMDDFQQMNEIYRSYFPAGNYPARTTIQSRLAREDMLLEIECVAEVPS